MDNTRIPYGPVESVDNSNFDFREGRVLAEGFLNANGNEAFKVDSVVTLCYRLLRWIWFKFSGENIQNIVKYFAGKEYSSLLATYNQNIFSQGKTPYESKLEFK